MTMTSTTASLHNLSLGSLSARQKVISSSSPTHPSGSTDRLRHLYVKSSSSAVAPRKQVGSPPAEIQRQHVEGSLELNGCHTVGGSSPVGGARVYVPSPLSGSEQRYTPPCTAARYSSSANQLVHDQLVGSPAKNPRAGGHSNCFTPHTGNSSPSVGIREQIGRSAESYHAKRYLEYYNHPYAGFVSPAGGPNQKDRSFAGSPLAGDCYERRSTCSYSQRLDGGKDCDPPGNVVLTRKEAGNRNNRDGSIHVEGDRASPLVESAHTPPHVGGDRTSPLVESAHISPQFGEDCTSPLADAAYTSPKRSRTYRMSASAPWNGGDSVEDVSIDEYIHHLETLQLKLSSGE